MTQGTRLLIGVKFLFSKPAFFSSVNKLQRLPMRNQPGVKGLPEKSADGFAAFFSVIKRPMIHVHPDKSVGQVATHLARKPDGVFNPSRAMMQAEWDSPG